MILLLCAAAFTGSMVLFGAKTEEIVYPLIICAVLAAGFMTADFLSERRRHGETEGIKTGEAAAISSLPEPDSIYEEDLTRIIGLLQDETAEMAGRYDSRYRDTVDYYTAWAHQIKTPIASMRLMLENEDIKESRRLSAELTRIERYADMVLTYIKTEHDANDLVLREHELSAIVKAAVRSFSAEFIDRGIRVDVRVPDRTIVTDDKWLIFVLEQLISNALKYSDGGTVSLYTEGDTLCVRDEGAGIAPEDLPRIFEKGYTGYNGRTWKKATGLGLYLAKKLCGDLGIGITASSEPGEGTVMMLDLSQRAVSGE